MNRYRNHAVAVLLLSFTITANAQERPTAVLLDEFGNFNCEDILARTDALAAELGREPRSSVLILIWPPKVRPEMAQGRRRLISSTMQLRGVTPDRYAFYKRGLAVDGEIRTQFWKLPPGAEPPVKDSVLWNEDPPDVSKAFLFGYSDETDVCPTFVPKAFVKLIVDNPGSRGHVVVTTGEDSIVEKFSFAEQWLKELVEVQGVPRKRLRLFFTKSHETGAEFWFIPARKMK